MADAILSAKQFQYTDEEMDVLEMRRFMWMRKLERAERQGEIDAKK
jgi:hypothetical protein